MSVRAAATSCTEPVYLRGDGKSASRADEDRGDVKKLIVQMTQEAMSNPAVQEHLATIEAKNTGAKTE